MVNVNDFASASGLRPMSAFVVIASVVASVALWVGVLSATRVAAQPNRVVRELGEAPSYALEDTRGNRLASFVPRFDLEMSPRSMWQAHTPQRIASGLAQSLGGVLPADELLSRMLPDAKDGVIRVEAWRLSVRQAHALNEWIECGAGSGSAVLEGLSVVRDGATKTGVPQYRLAWEPARLLSKRVRAQHGFSSAWRWARHLADGIDLALRRPGLADLTTAEKDRRRADVWSALMPSGFCMPVRGIPSHRVLAVRELLAEEGVSPWQMKISYARDRVYPCGEHELYGSWGFVDENQSAPAPRGGLELLGERLLREDGWAWLARQAPSYTWIQDRSVRGERANGFFSFKPGSDEPVVRSTIDLRLQRRVRDVLEDCFEEHRPAVAQAIVIDLASGDVLAVDALEATEIAPFAPVFHEFTPGSTLKLVTMAIALEEGVVRPNETFDVGYGEYILRDGRSARAIHEAEGHLNGIQTAERCLAFSMNAGLVQIGLRVPDAAFHGYLTALGYGAPPGSGLPAEKSGRVPPLPWTRIYTQASITFGHEFTTTLWQHATGLASILRGGVYRPLRLIRGVRQADEWFELPVEDGQRVFSPKTCAAIRDMMRMGAKEGTGKGVWREGLDMGTKTGTAEKVPAEVCLHVEMMERARRTAAGLPLDGAWYRSLRSKLKPHRSCYTSSMCIVAPTGGRDEREVMVLVVVDEPRGPEKYGSKVAGPAAMAILSEALDLTRNGAEYEPEVVAGFAPSPLEAVFAAEFGDPGGERD